MDLKERIEKALKEIRPFLLADNGDISLVSIEEDEVKVRLEGACVDCSINQMTLKNGGRGDYQKIRSRDKKSNRC